MASIGKPLKRTLTPRSAALAEGVAGGGESGITRFELAQAARAQAAAAERALASAVAKQRQVARRASVAAHHVAALAVLDARQERRHLIKRIKECPASLQSAPLALLRDDGFLLDCVRHCPEALSYVPRPRYDDKDFLVKAVQVSEARAFRHGRRRWVVSKPKSAASFGVVTRHFPSLLHFCAQCLSR